MTVNRDVYRDENATAALLTAVPGTGIGDFGARLQVRLSQTISLGRVIHATPETRAGLRAMISSVNWPGALVTNLGLTSWGPSRPLNFLANIGIAFRTRRHRQTVVLLHNVVESMNIEHSGYHVGAFTLKGAHLAVQALERCKIIVFSDETARVLRERYEISPALVRPLPCDTPANTPATSNLHGSCPTVIIPGYLSPYKGLETLPEVKRLVQSPCRFIVIGGPHNTLLRDPGYRTRLTSLVNDLRAAEIRVAGRLADTEFDSALRHSTLGLLPYSSTQGGSAMFSHLASMGVPVIATELPEFRWLETLGAGVLCTGPDPREIASAIDRLLSDSGELSRLRERQARFATKFSWSGFGSEIASLIRNDAN